MSRPATTLRDGSAVFRLRHSHGFGPTTQNPIVYRAMKV